MSTLICKCHKTKGRKKGRHRKSGRKRSSKRKGKCKFGRKKTGRHGCRKTKK